MGYAVGVLGMRLDDFCRMSPGEFEAVSEAFAQRQDAMREDSWEMMRLHASICIQPHVAKRVTPRELLPLPWDGKTAEVRGGSLDKAERLRRAAKRIKRANG